jgi:hypothetical protein
MPTKVRGKRQKTKGPVGREGGREGGINVHEGEKGE